MPEISEGAAAAALLIPASQLVITNEKQLNAALKKVYNIVKHNTKINMSVGERADYIEWFNPATLDEAYKKKNKDAKLTAIVHGYSSALAINQWFTTTHHESTADVQAGNVFLTGGSRDNKIKFLQVTAQNWKDYNSSDIVVIKGKCYYGISLKKKNTSSAANPPMINKSIVALLADLGKTKISEELYESRVGFYGGLVTTAATSGKPLAGSKNIPTNKEKAFKTQIRHVTDSKSEWVNLIDLKGPAKLSLEKGSLQQYISNVNTKGEIICSLIQQTLADLKSGLKNKKVKIIIDKIETKKVEDAEKLTGKGPPAKMFFVVVIGDKPILEFQIRYKGSFSPSPQFLGGMTSYFETLLKTTAVREKYQFGKACN
jgi:hypothetical protein